MPSNLPNNKQFVSISKAAEILDVSVDTIRRWDKKGIIKAERPNGKDRYFSIEELEKHKFSKPLGISQVSEQLGISASTLRRLEKKGLIKPQRNSNGERTYDRDSVKAFLGSEYFLREKEVEEKVLEPLERPEKREVSLEPLHKMKSSYKIINAIVQNQEEEVSRLKLSRNTFFVSVLFVAFSFALIIIVITVMFLLFPRDTATFFGLAVKPNGKNIVAVSQSNETVLGSASKENDNQVGNQVLGSVLKPFAGISLEVVRQISPETYEKVIPARVVSDSSKNAILFLNQEDQIVPQYPVKLPESSFLQILDTDLINNLNAQYLEGKIPGEEAGDLVVFGENGKIDSLRISSVNLLDGSVTSLDLGDDSVTSSKIKDGEVKEADIVDGAVTSAKLKDGEVKNADLADGAVTSSKISDNTITATDLNATLTFADGDFLDLGAVIHDDSAVQGLRLPNASSASPTSLTSGEGFIAWDTSGNQVIAYNGSSWAAVSGTGDITAVTAGNGLSGGGTSGDASLAVSLTTSGTSGSTSSNSGLEVSSSGLTLLKGCTDGQLLEWTDASGWACANDDNSGGSGSSNWRIGSGAISPVNDTLDLLIGATTTGSAKFAAININSGTPTATISANSGNNATTLTGLGVLGTTNAQSLTLGNSSTGDILITPAGTLALTARGANLIAAGTLTGLTGLTSSGTITFSGFSTDKGVIYTNGTGVLSQTAQGASNTVLHGNAGSAPTFSAVSLTADVTGILPTANGGSFWNSANGALYPGNSTLDLIIGGVASTSAYFRATGNAAFAGTTSAASVSARTSFAGLVVDNTIGDLFTASSAGVTQFVIRNNGAVAIGGGVQIPLAQLDVRGSATVSGNLTLAGAARSIQTTANNTLTIGGNTTGNITISPQDGGANGILNLNTTTLQIAGTAGSTVGTASCVTTTDGIVTGSGSCPASGGSNWTVASGTIRPNQATVLDLLIGGDATGSARFAAININSGTPTATISANSGNNATTLTGLGVLGTTNAQSLTLGNSSTGDILITPGGTLALTARGANLIAGGTLTGLTGLTSSGTITFSGFSTDKGVIYTNGTGVLSQTAQGASNTVLHGNAGSAPTFSAVSLTADVTGILPTANGGSFWNSSSGALYPGNSTLDLLIGATTTGSAKFAAININSGTPTATISANSGNNATTLTGLGVLGTTNAQSLTLGNSSTGDILITPAGTLALTARGANLIAGGTLTGLTGLTSSGTITFSGFSTDKGLLYTNGTGVLSQTAQGASNTVLHGNAGSAPTFSAVSLTADVTGILPTANGGSFFNSSNGALYPGNSTLDLLVGGVASTSAYFRATGNAALAGTTSAASVSARTSFAGFVVDNTIGDLFTASSSGVTQFVIRNNGAVGIGAVSIPLAQLDVRGDATVSGGLTLAGAARSIQTTANNLLTIGGNTTGDITISPLNGGAGGIINLNATDLQIAGTAGSTVGTASCVTTTDGIVTGSGSCPASGGSNWTVASGTIRPNQATVLDLLLGGDATTSAKFAVLNVNSGTTVASLSATTTGLVLSAGGSIQGLQNATLTVGGNTTGQVVLSGRNGSSTGITFSGYTAANGVLYGDSAGVINQATTGSTGLCLTSGASVPTWGSCAAGAGSNWTITAGTIRPNQATALDLLIGGDATSSALFRVTGGNTFAGTTSAASVSARTSFAGFVVDNRGVGDLFTASVSGATKFTILNNGNLQFAGQTNFLTTLASAATANRTITFPDVTGTLCTSVANCTQDAFWNTSSGALYPGNSTMDLLVGGVSSSAANFRVTGNAAFAGTTSAASVSGRTSFAAFVVDNAGVGDLITASSSGLTRFRIDSNGNASFSGQLIASNQGIEFGESDSSPICGNGQYTIYADLSETKLKKCTNGAVSDLDTTGGGATVKSGKQASVTEGTPATITFATAFSSTPNCVVAVDLGGSGSGTRGEAFITTTPSTTSFAVDWNDSTGGAAKIEDIQWMCTDAGNADLAEVFATNDTTISAGDVVSLDATLKAGVKKSGGAYDKNAFGIVSSEPAITIGSTEGEGKWMAAVALVGRVPVKVNRENGSIKSGDLLTSSSIPGVAMKATKAGNIIGQAMSEFNEEGTGFVLSFVRTDFTSGGKTADILTGLTQEEDMSIKQDIGKAILTQFISERGRLEEAFDLSEMVTDRLAAGFEVITPKIVTQSVLTDEIKPSTGKDITLELGEDGKFVLRHSGLSRISSMDSGKGDSGVSRLNRDPQNDDEEVISFDSKGNAFFAGELTANKIKANRIEGLEIFMGQVAGASTSSARLQVFDPEAQTQRGETLQDLLVQVGDLSSRVDLLTSSATISALLFEPIATDTGVLNSLDTKDATISGDLRVRGSGLIEGVLSVVDTLTTQNFILNTLATFFGDVVFKGNIVFQGRPTFNKDTAGIAVIKKGEDRVEVVFEKEYKDIPVVNISATIDEVTKETDETEEARVERQKKLEQDILNGDIRYIVANRTTKGFVIKINKQAVENLKFSWSSLAVEGVNEVSTASEAAEVLPTITPSEEKNITISEDEH